MILITNETKRLTESAPTPILAPTTINDGKNKKFKPTSS